MTRKISRGFKLDSPARVGGRPDAQSAQRPDLEVVIDRQVRRFTTRRCVEGHNKYVRLVPILV
jgi:hypothetical protein